MIWFYFYWSLNSLSLNSFYLCSYTLLYFYLSISNSIYLYLSSFACLYFYFCLCIDASSSFARISFCFYSSICFLFIYIYRYLICFYSLNCIYRSYRSLSSRSSCSSLILRNSSFYLSFRSVSSSCFRRYSFICSFYRSLFFASSYLSILFSSYSFSFFSFFSSLFPYPLSFKYF